MKYAPYFDGAWYFSDGVEAWGPYPSYTRAEAGVRIARANELIILDEDTVTIVEAVPEPIDPEDTERMPASEIDMAGTRTWARVQRDFFRGMGAREYLAMPSIADHVPVAPDRLTVGDAMIGVALLSYITVVCIVEGVCAAAIAFVEW